MQAFNNRLAAWTAVAALGAASLFAQTQQTPQFRHRHGLFGQKLASTLNLTDDQKAQAKSIFGEARQSAKPIRQQMMETRKSLHAAIQSGNTDQIQQLSATEGSQMGQLTAIRSSAFAKFYKTLTPDQQQKLDSARQSMHNRRQPG